MEPSDDLLAAISTDADLFADVVIRNPDRENNQTTLQKAVPLHYKLWPIIAFIFTRDDIWNAVKNPKLYDDNANPQFIMLEGNPTRDQCQNAKLRLDDLRNGDVFNVIFICTDSNRNINIYTVNHYNEIAPQPWVYVDDIKSELYPKGAISIYKHVHDKTISCQALFYEKILKLDRPVRMNMKPFPPLTSINMDKATPMIRYNKKLKPGLVEIEVAPDEWQIFNDFDSLVLGTIFKILNATVIVNVYPAKRDHVNDDFMHDMLEDVKYGRIDIGLNSRDMSSMSAKHMDMLYTFVEKEVTIITNIRKDMDIIATQIEAYFNVNIIITLLIIFFLVVVAFGCLSGQKFGPALLNALRFFLGINVQVKMTRLPARLFYGCMMAYFFIVIANFAANFTCISVFSHSTQNVNSLNDVNALGYTVYAGYDCTKYLQLFEKRSCHSNVSYIDHCAELLLVNSQAACIEDTIYANYAIAKYRELRMTKETLVKFHTFYPIRKNWLTRYRIDILLSRLKESGLLDIWLEWQTKSFDFGTSIVNVRERVIIRKFNAIILDEYRDFFLIFALGLLLSVIAFVFEFLV